MLFHVEINGQIITSEPLEFSAAQDHLLANLARKLGPIGPGERMSLADRILKAAEAVRLNRERMEQEQRPLLVHMPA